MFGDVVRQLEDIGVSTFPYINGRIFDVNSESFKRVGGDQYCCASSRVQLQDKDLSYYQESYGSGATFHVANPNTT